MESFQSCTGDLTPAILEHYLGTDAIAVDTETMGLNPHRDRLCLVQLSDPAGHVTVVRVERGQAHAPHLQQLLETAHIPKMFHFARFDLATLKHHLNIVVQPIFCTKLASKLARTYSPKHGLKDLVKELTGVELDKTAQSSDWGNATNLTDEQLSYAANDVRYLHTLCATLTQMLQREGRWELAQRCFDCLPTIVELDLLQYDDVFKH